jgi:hypothetical protein
MVEAEYAEKARQMSQLRAKIGKALQELAVVHVSSTP